MKPQKPYTLFKRANGIYYARFRLADGTRTAGMSTGETAKARAERWAVEYLQKVDGRIIKRTNATLADYAKGFFDFNGEWATNKKVEGRRISERHCLDRQDIMRLHVLPALGKFNLDEIDKHVLKKFRNDLHAKGFSSSLINKALYAVTTILQDAEDRDIIRAVPKVTKAADNSKQKGILTIDEVKQLFASWTADTPRQRIARAGNVLAASTGLRISELQGIQIQDLHLDGGYITIRRAWDNRLNKLTMTTKTGRERNIFIPAKVADELRELLAIHPLPDSTTAFLFWGEKLPMEKPAEKVVFTRALYAAMRSIGISEEERRRRAVSFHSWRYFLNSMLINAKIPLWKVKSITGHITDQMSERYYAVDDVTDVLQITEGIFTE